MVKKLFLQLTPFIILICMFAYIMSIYTNILEIPYLVSHEYNHITIWEYDFYGYVQNINNSFTDITILELKWPPRQWSTGILLGDFINNVAFIFDWLYMPLNLLLYPVRITAWILRNCFSLLGIPTIQILYNNHIYNPPWFIETLNWMTTNLSIPYI